MKDATLKLLIVEDQELNRRILSALLQPQYTVLEAADGAEALELLYKHQDISAILLDLVMPVMDGYTFLQKLRETKFAALPVIAVTGETDKATEQRVLELGAWDFVSKPYQADVLLMRLKNAIIRSNYYLLSEMRYAYEFDPLTGLYNRTKFFLETRKLLDQSPDDTFVLIRFDINQFHLLNSFWGEEEGDSFLRFIADALRRFARQFEPCTYARINADTFCLCQRYDKRLIEEQIHRIAAVITTYNENYLIDPAFGVYVIGDSSEKIQTMLERATLAAKECKGSFLSLMRYYTPEMSLKATWEQKIVGEMQHALDTEQFLVYLQPKYNLKTERPYGAEALIRWQHPTHGLLTPGAFIPIFESNGFIDKIDCYVWEHVCRILRRWLDEGREPAPISVNVSRVDMYNPNLVSTLLALTKKYGVPPRLLNLELTESAYMDNPEIMEKTVRRLQSEGFVIMMDDFGSGYSSLNTLKDIPIDVLKIDMKFLSGDAEPGRKECIMASMIHMAGWLNIPVIMEGVETREQVNYLKSIGCSYAQGYFYARPMPVAAYESLVRGTAQKPAESRSDNHEPLVRTIWSDDSRIDFLFNSFQQPAAVYGFENNAFYLIRVNQHFNETFGYGSGIQSASQNPISQDAGAEILSVFQRVSTTQRVGSCTFLWEPSGKHLTLTLQYWGANETTSILFALFSPS